MEPAIASPPTANAGAASSNGGASPESAVSKASADRSTIALKRTSVADRFALAAGEARLIWRRLPAPAGLEWRS
jgi:hypothetical protein